MEEEEKKDEIGWIRTGGWKWRRKEGGRGGWKRRKRMKLDG